MLTEIEMVNKTFAAEPEDLAPDVSLRHCIPLSSSVVADSAAVALVSLHNRMSLKALCILLLEPEWLQYSFPDVSCITALIMDFYQSHK